MPCKKRHLSTHGRTFPVIKVCQLSLSWPPGRMGNWVAVCPALILEVDKTYQIEFNSCFKLIVKTCVCFVNSKVSIWSPIAFYCIFSNGPTSGPWFHELLKASFSLRNFPNSWAEIFQPTPGPGCKVLFRFCIFQHFSWFMMPTLYPWLSVVVVLLQSIALILDCMSSSFWLWAYIDLECLQIHVNCTRTCPVLSTWRRGSKPSTSWGVLISRSGRFSSCRVVNAESPPFTLWACAWHPH